MNPLATQLDWLGQWGPALPASTGAACLVAWGAALGVRRRVASRPGRAVLALARVGAMTGALLSALAAASSVVVFATDWPLWAIALGGALAIETLAGLYGVERRGLSRRAGWGMTALRAGVLLATLAMLAQPVRRWSIEHRHPRYVAVLVDESASMYVTDSHRSGAETLRLAEAFAPDVPARPYGFEDVASALGETRTGLGRTLQAMRHVRSLPGSDERIDSLAERREAWARDLAAIRKTLGDQLLAVDEPLSKGGELDAALRERIDDVKARLNVQVHDRLAEAEAVLQSSDARRLGSRLDRLCDNVSRALASLGEATGDVAALGERLDEAFFASLSDEQRRRIGGAVARPRSRLVRDCLFHSIPDGESGSLHERLKAGWDLRGLTFAASTSPAPLERWAGEYAADDHAGGNDPQGVGPESLPASAQSTDLAGAIDEALSSVPSDELSGVLIFTDGRHNGSAEALWQGAGRLRRLAAPICTVAMGATRPPCDAAIVSVDAPETVFAGDGISFSVEVKLAGLAGRKATVRLMDGNETVDQREVPVPAGTDDHRARLRLRHARETTGLHRYVVRVESDGEEILAENNSFGLAVRVTEDRVRLLLIDGRPRYEFRYLKNLFADRDQSVRLQYVLLEPDRIGRDSQRETVHASASAQADRVEATALPADRAEWLKFDVVILGDVDPAALDADDLEALTEFVAVRGGTLVVVAGQHHMPADYAASPLADLLPVDLDGRTGPQGGLAGRAGALGVPSADAVYRASLTSAGRHHVVTSQAVGEEDNERIWAEMPDLYWRHPLCRARPGATVLADALGGRLAGRQAVFDDEPWRAGLADDATPEQLLDARLAYERSRALIAAGRVSAGRVLMLTYDRTWRMRQGIGDVRHHRFWGQVMRWATSDKIGGGTEFVKLGTDRTRYEPGQPVRVRAKLVLRDYSPLETEGAWVNVYRGGKPVRRGRLEYVEGSPGIHEIRLQGLPGGVYRAELECEEARPLLDSEDVDTVATEFSVDPAVPDEQVELSVDMDLLRRLASETGGVCARAHEAARVLDALGEKVEHTVEYRQILLWNSWAMLGVIVALATGEWLLRKKVGLP